MKLPQFLSGAPWRESALAAAAGAAGVLVAGIAAAGGATRGYLLHTASLGVVLPVGAFLCGGICVSGLCVWLLRLGIRPRAAHYAGAALLGLAGAVWAYGAVYATLHLTASPQARYSQAELDDLRARGASQESELNRLTGEIRRIEAEAGTNAAQESAILAGQQRVLTAEYKETVDRYEAKRKQYQELPALFEANQTFRGERIGRFMGRVRGKPYGFADYLRDSFCSRRCGIAMAAPRLPPARPAEPSLCSAVQAVCELLGFICGALWLIFLLERTFFPVILVACEGCGKTLRIPAAKGGIKIRCPNCGKEARLI